MDKRLTKRQREVLRAMNEGKILRRHVSSTRASVDGDYGWTFRHSTWWPLVNIGLIEFLGNNPKDFEAYGITDAGVLEAVLGDGAEVAR